MNFKALTILLFTLSFSAFSLAHNDSIKTLDSLIQKTSNIDDKITLLEQLYSAAVNNDSLKNESLKKLIKYTYRKKDWMQFNKYRLEHIRYTKNNNDSLSLAKTLYYSGAYFNRVHQSDSSYYYYLKSNKIYKKVNDSLSVGKILLNIAASQKNIHDYSNSIATSFEALSYLKNLDNARRESSIYNNLGIVYNQLKNEDKSLKFHKKARELRKEIKETKLYYLQSLNNIGKANRDYGDYDEALKNFDTIFQYKELLDKNPKFKAVVIDNYAFTLYKKGIPENVEKQLINALRIRDSIDDKNGIIISAIHLSEYYASQKDTLTAIKYAKRAESLSQTTKNYRDYLESLELMSDLYDTKEAKKHFKKYIAIRDSLDLEDKIQKDSFYKIRYDIDEKENIISSQSDEINTKSNIIIVIISSVILILIILFYRKSRVKKKLKTLKENTANNFKDYLINKYSLTEENIIFWELWVTKLSQEEMADKLSISIDSVKSRRKSLRNRINKTQPIKGDFDQALAIIIYNKEKEFHSSI